MKGVVAVAAYIIVWTIALIILTLLEGMFLYLVLILSSAATGILLADFTRKVGLGYWWSFLYMVIASVICFFSAMLLQPFNRFSGGGGYGDLMAGLIFILVYPILAQITYTVFYFILKARGNKSGT
jgi:hypothetical protein